jgi:hypothetical protein
VGILRVPADAPMKALARTWVRSGIPRARWNAVQVLRDSMLDRAILETLMHDPYVEPCFDGLPERAWSRDAFIVRIAAFDALTTQGISVAPTVLDRPHHMLDLGLVGCGIVLALGVAAVWFVRRWSGRRAARSGPFSKWRLLPGLVLVVAVIVLGARSFWHTDDFSLQIGSKRAQCASHRGFVRIFVLSGVQRSLGNGYTVVAARDAGGDWDLLGPRNQTTWALAGLELGSGSVSVPGVPQLLLWLPFESAACDAKYGSYGVSYAWIALIAAGFLARRVIPLVRAFGRLKVGLCHECGYDLRASPKYCPECGTTRLPVPEGEFWSLRR